MNSSVLTKQWAVLIKVTLVNDVDGWSATAVVRRHPGCFSRRTAVDETDVKEYIYKYEKRLFFDVKSSSKKNTHIS